MTPLREPAGSETVKLGPPSAGEVTIASDPGKSGAVFAAGTQTLRPGAKIPEWRHLDRDVALFVYKGQGRATLNDQSMIVLPGAMLHMPRGAWYGLSNTGNGALQIVWTSAPAGLEAFWRDLSQLGAAPTPEAIREVAQRHRIELRQPGQGGEAPASVAGTADAEAGHERRRHRGGRRHRRGRGGADASPASRSVTSSAAEPVAEMPSADVSPTIAGPDAPQAKTSTAAGEDRGRRRRHRGGRGRGGRARGSASQAAGTASSNQSSAQSSAQPSEVQANAPASAPAATPAATRPDRKPSRRSEERRSSGSSSSSRSSSSSSSSSRSSGRSGGRPRGRVREVFMNGRWVQVEKGETYIATSSDQGRPPRKSGGDDDPPEVSLSVML